VQSDWVIPLRDLNRIRPLFSLAFPSLFPDGNGGFVAYRKTEVISIDWLRHLLMQGSWAFARHVDFIFVAVNVLRDSQIANRAQFHVQRTYDEYSAADLQLAVQHEDIQFLGKVLRYSASTLTGTAPWWGTALHGGLEVILAIVLLTSVASFLKPFVPVLSSISTALTKTSRDATLRLKGQHQSRTLVSKVNQSAMWTKNPSLVRFVSSFEFPMWRCRNHYCGLSWHFL
jgi:hypothetical protein